MAARGLAALAPAVLAAAPLAAQHAPAFGGAELRAGVVFAEQAVAGPGAMVEADLGHLWRPELRVIAGLGRFVANIDREPGGDEGSFAATGVWLAARYDLFPLATTGGYVRVGLTLHSVDADAWDQGVDALLSGANTGAGVAVGVRRRVDTAGRLSGTVELRRTAMNNIGHTAIEAGVRYQPRGVATYAPRPVAARPLNEPPARPVAEPRGQTPAGDPAPVAAAPPDDAARSADAAPAAEEARAAVEARARRDREAREAADAAEAAELATLAAERAAVAEALLRQGLGRATASMRSATGVQETPVEFVVTLGGTAFASGAATLSAAARRELRVLATVLAGYPGHIVSVEGHADAVGDASANRALSVERAKAVRAGLIAEGVDPLWVGARGFGGERPVATNDTGAGRAANRRVEIRILKTPCPEPPRIAADGEPVCPAR